MSEWVSDYDLYGDLDFAQALINTQRADGRDEWATPNYIYEELCAYWNVWPQIDMFASLQNRKCGHHFGFDTPFDAFRTDWFGYAEANNLDPYGWLQPPYSQPTLTDSIAKAIKEASKGFTSLFLLPSNVDQTWYHDMILDEYSHRPYRGRIKFEPPPGIKASTPRYGNIHGVIEPDYQRKQRLCGGNYSVEPHGGWYDWENLR